MKGMVGLEVQTQKDKEEYKVICYVDTDNSQDPKDKSETYDEMRLNKITEIEQFTDDEKKMVSKKVLNSIYKGKITVK